MNSKRVFTQIALDNDVKLSKQAQVEMNKNCYEEAHRLLCLLDNQRIAKNMHRLVEMHENICLKKHRKHIRNIPKA